MVNPIPNSINKLWEQWNIRGAILFSLFLQISLVTFSPLRKRTQNVFLLFSIWPAYLVADMVANFCVGHIASNLDPTSQSIISTHSDLLAFWAPFLLVHLGGPDTITAFSLEDNQLWLRHMLGLIIQFISCAYVFLLTVPGNKLWIPAVLVFVAGMIKYGERTYALYLASKYQTVVSDYIPTNVMTVSNIDEIPTDGDVEMLSQVGVVLVAYNFFWSKFHEIVELMFNVRKELEFFHRITAQDALRVIEVELNFYYEACFTKFLVLGRTSGYLCRFVAITCLFVAFGLFFSKDKHKQGFDVFDVKVTYVLLFGAMALDTVALLMLLFSDRAIIYFHQHVSSCFFILKTFHELINRQKWSKCKKKPYTKFTELSTWVPFRRWKGSISGFNMISYSCSKKKFFLLSHHRYSGILMLLHEVKNPFLLEFWDFIFSELKRKSEEAQDTETAEMICKSRGGWILKKSLVSEERRENLMPYVDASKIAFDESLIVWHIATHLCYVQELDDYQVDEREFSKLLSDYMMSLLVLRSNIISVEGGIGQKRFQDALAAVMPFFIDEGDEVEACKKLLAEVTSDTNIPLLSDACMLAKELGMISQGGVKWKIISQVWVELLSFAACNCRIFINFQHLSKGGELISLVWLLMIRLGLREEI